MPKKPKSARGQRPSKKPRKISTLQSRNVMGARGITSIRLEPELWAALDRIAGNLGVTRDEVVQQIATDNKGKMLTSAVRVFIVQTLLAERTQ